MVRMLNKEQNIYTSSITYVLQQNQFKYYLDYNSVLIFFTFATKKTRCTELRNELFTKPIKQMYHSLLYYDDYYNNVQLERWLKRHEYNHNVSRILV